MAQLCRALISVHLVESATVREIEPCIVPFQPCRGGRRLSVRRERAIEGPETTIVAQYDDLLRLVTENCTIEQVKAVLRPALGNKNVKLSANSKEDLVD